jgi:hypothetical protein
MKRVGLSDADIDDAFKKRIGNRYQNVSLAAEIFQKENRDQAVRWMFSRRNRAPSPDFREATPHHAQPRCD